MTIGRRQSAAAADAGRRLAAERQQEIVALAMAGLPPVAIQARVGLSRGHIYNVLAKARRRGRSVPRYTSGGWPRGSREPDADAGFRSVRVDLDTLAALEPAAGARHDGGGADPPDPRRPGRRRAGRRGARRQSSDGAAAMSWITARRFVRPQKPATVTIILRAQKRGDGPPAFDLYLPARALHDIGWTGGARIGLSIGSEDLAGWLRLAPADGDEGVSARVAANKGGTAFLSFGRVVGLFEGMCGRAAVRFDQAGDAITLAIPERDAFAGRARKRAAATPKPAATSAVAAIAPAGQPAPAASVGPNGKAAKPVTIRGLTIDLTKDEESLSFGGATMDVTGSQGSLAWLLARAAPRPRGEDFLRRQVWGSDAHAGEKYRVAPRDLGKALAGLGLGLKTIKGVGVQITGLKG